MTSHDDRSTPREASTDDTGEHAAHPRYDEQLEGDAFEVMRKYQVVTMPPHARLELMQMKLPEAPTELLQDTVPPNGSLTAPPAPEPDVTTGSEKDFFNDPRAQETVLVPRVVRRRRNNGLLVALVLGSLVALSLGASLWLTRAPERAPVGPVERPNVPASRALTTEAVSAVPAEPPSSEERAPKAPAAKSTTAVKRPQAPSQQTERPQSPKPVSAPGRGKQPWIDGI